MSDPSSSCPSGTSRDSNDRCVSNCGGMDRGSNSSFSSSLGC